MASRRSSSPSRFAPSRARSAWIRIAGLMPPSTETNDASHDRELMARHFAEARRDQRVGEIAELAQRHGLGLQRQRQDRRIGRVHLRIDRGIGKIARQRRGRCVDRRLHVLRGGVDVAVEIELQRDLRQAERRLRRHGRERRDLTELALERGRDQRSDRVGIGAGQPCRDLDGRKIDLWQRRNRKARISEQPREQNGDPEQRGRDRPRDEGRRDVHGAARRLTALLPRGAGRADAAGRAMDSQATPHRRPWARRPIWKNCRFPRSIAAASG